MVTLVLFFPYSATSMFENSPGYTTVYSMSHVLVGPMNPGAALIVKMGGTNISANVRDGALSHKIDHLTYLTDTV